MHKFDFSALGTHWWIELFSEMNQKNADEVADFVRCFVADFEARYSRFKPDSEVSQLNRDRVLYNPSEETRQFFGYSIDLYRRTRGVFNVLVGHILEARGYDGAYSFIDKGSVQLHPGNPLTDLSIDTDAIRLQYGSIDLGGYGKGWLIDRLAELLQDQFGVKQFLINGGGDMYATHHNNEPFTIYLEDPLHPGKITGSTGLKNRAFAASSPHKRSWPITNAPGAVQHHIVSTQTKRETTAIKDAIYLTAPTAVDADAFATTLLQVDSHETQKLTQENNISILYK